MRCLGLASGAASGTLQALYIRKLGEGNTASRPSARELVEGLQRDRFVVAGGMIGTVVPAVLTICALNSKTRAGRGRSRRRGWLRAPAPRRPTGGDSRPRH